MIGFLVNTRLCKLEQVILLAFNVILQIDKQYEV